MKQQTLEAYLKTLEPAIQAAKERKERLPKLKKYSLRWWFEFGKMSKQDGYPHFKSKATNKLADIAWKIGYLVA